MALEITNLRFLDRMRRTGQPPGADVSMLKIKGTEIQQALTELAVQAADPNARETQALGAATSTCARPRSTRAPTRSRGTSSPR